MFHSHQRVVASLLVALTLVLGLVGCADGATVWVDESAAYTAASIGEPLDTADISRVSERPTAEAQDLRHDALSSLRKQGDSASQVADMLTSTFDPDTRGVPVYVEKASFEGTSVVIVVEATGPKSGALTLKRLWVLGEDGSVILARSR